MWHYGLLEGMEAPLPEGCSIVEVATYECPFATEYVGCVMLISAKDGNPAPYAMVVNAIHGETLDYQTEALADNLFIALVEFETAKAHLEVVVNSCAMANLMRVSQWS